MAPVKLNTSPAPVDDDFSNMNLDVGTAILLMVASTNGQVNGNATLNAMSSQVVS